MVFDEILLALSLAGTAVFAVSGALQALRRDMDVVGVAFIACVTGVGGGTMRDLLTGATPVGWVTDPTDIVVCIAFAVITMFFGKALEGKRFDYLLWADAAGLALFAVLGALKGLEAGAHPFIAILFGAMSATFGGIVRDVICSEQPVIFRKEVYISAALIGAALLVLLPESLSLNARIVISVLGGFIVRGCAIHFAWTMPMIVRRS